MRYLVVYSSVTGNTRRVAEAVFHWIFNIDKAFIIAYIPILLFEMCRNVLAYHQPD